MAKVITLCGSSRFKDAFINVNEYLTLSGNVVLSLGIFSRSSYYTVSDYLKKQLIELHRQKIDMCDEIYVIDIDSYVGSDTASEIWYAESKGKKVNLISHSLDIMAYLKGCD